MKIQEILEACTATLRLAQSVMCGKTLEAVNQQVERVADVLFGKTQEWAGLSDGGFGGRGGTPSPRTCPGRHGWPKPRLPA